MHGWVPIDGDDVATLLGVTDIRTIRERLAKYEIPTLPVGSHGKEIVHLATMLLKMVECQWSAEDAERYRRCVGVPSNAKPGSVEAEEK